ncbi:peroxiredoxin [Bdellovibrio sp. HCB337]|uniref:peroxiredoxin n=1 Tax=Bdellovibrio sp. HCB337 TaxID=3394358 RepID=UPI0039A75C59
MNLNSQVPDFSIPSTYKGDISLSSLRGKKVVLYFYPKDNTPGCTVEGQEFNELYPQFQAANAEVFGVSRDSVKSHDKFICKFNFKFELLSDADEKLCKIFDVIKEKNMYGKMVLGIERSTFVIDENGKLVGEFRKIKAQGHAKQMLDFVKGL